MRCEAPHRQQFAVAALALHPFDRHDAAQALGVVAGVAIVALRSPRFPEWERCKVAMPAVGQAVP